MCFVHCTKMSTPLLWCAPRGGRLLTMSFLSWWQHPPCITRTFCTPPCLALAGSLLLHRLWILQQGNDLSKNRVYHFLTFLSEMGMVTKYFLVPDSRHKSQSQNEWLTAHPWDVTNETIFLETPCSQCSLRVVAPLYICRLAPDYHAHPLMTISPPSSYIHPFLASFGFVFQTFAEFKKAFSPSLLCKGLSEFF